MITLTAMIIITTGLLVVTIEIVMWEVFKEPDDGEPRPPPLPPPPRPPKPLKKEIGYREWKRRTWYKSSSATSPPSQAEWEYVFSERRKTIEEGLEKDNVMEIQAAKHPACTAAAKLQEDGTLPEVLPANWPCVKYAYGQASGNPLHPSNYFAVKNAVLHKGEVYSTTRESARTYSIPGYFSSLKGKMHQIVESQITLYPFNTTFKTPPSVVCDIGIYQTPTDYHTMWHVLAEVLIPLFHGLLPWIVSGNSQRKICIVHPWGGNRPWGSPSAGMLKLIKNLGTDWQICAISGSEKCLSTEFGKMAKDIAKVFVDPLDKPVLIKKFLIGAPSTCLPVWGLDGVPISAAGLNHFGTECGRVMWGWKNFWGHKYGKITPSPAAPRYYVIWASRKGDWARDIINENKVLHEIQAVRGHHVNVTKFAMPMGEQYRLLQHASHLVAPHGASMMHCLFLQPGAVFITVDVQFPPFSGPTIEPPWVHRYHYQGKLECNPRHPKNQKNCKHIFRKPDVDQNKHNQPVSQHNNHVSVNVSSFMEMYDATLVALRG